MFVPSLRVVAFAGALLPVLVPAAPLTLDQALDLAVQRSEATRSARAAVASAAEAARAAGQLPDPVLRAGIDNLPVTGADRLSTTRDSMTMKRIGIGQEWVSAEKRAARQAAAEARVGREAVGVQAAAAEARLQAALAYLDAYFAGEMLALAELSEHHIHEELAAAEARLASAAGSSQEVLAGTAARGLAEDESAELRQRQGAARVALARWVGVAADELAAPTEPDGLDQAAFVAGHPAVLAAQRALESARREAAVTASNRAPNWSWEVSYGQRSGYSDMVSVGVSIPLPVSPAERQDRETSSMLALADRAEGDLAEATRAAEAEFLGLASDARRLGERIQRYQSAVVAPCRQRTAAALAAYGSGQLTLTTLFEARHAEVQARRQLLALQADLARTQARLAFRPVANGAAR